VNASNARFDDFGGGNITAPVALMAAIPRRAVEPAALNPATPGRLELSNAYPNPTHSGVFFSLALPEGQEVAFSVFDIQGREVWSDPPREFGAGRWTIGWDGMGRGGPARTGVYLARVRVGSQVLLRRLMVIH
jgi:hypothetical protein